MAIEKRLDLGMDEEEAQMDAYEKFISYCIQYHTDGIKPLGFVLSNYVIAVIKAEQVCDAPLKQSFGIRGVEIRLIRASPGKKGTPL